PDPAALAAFLDMWRFTGSRAGDEAELTAVHRLRAVLSAVWTADEDEVVAVVNRLLRDGHALPQLVRHDGWGHHLHATGPTAPLDRRTRGMDLGQARSRTVVLLTGRSPLGRLGPSPGACLGHLGPRAAEGSVRHWSGAGDGSGGAASPLGPGAVVDGHAGTSE